MAPAAAKAASRPSVRQRMREKSSMVPPMATTTMAVPRSGWRRMSTAGSSVMPSGTAMPTRPRGVLRRSSSRWNQLARAMMTAILASSDGCRLREPKPIQRRAPITTRPFTKTSSSRAMTTP